MFEILAMIFKGIGRGIKAAALFWWDQGAVIKLVLAPFYFAALLFLSLPFLYVFHPTIGVYSHGYRMGNIHRWTPNREHPWSIITTYEGSMYLGNQSVDWTNPATGKQENPWDFSSTRTKYTENHQNVGSYEVVEYEQNLFQLNNWRGDTDYQVVNVVPPNPALAPEACGKTEEEAAPGFLDLNSKQGGGDNSGRLVKVSTKGNFIKTWEARIQLGDSGGKFIDVSIVDSAIFECAVKYVKSGVPVGFVFNQKHFVLNKFSQATNITIEGMHKVKNASLPGSTALPPG